MKRNGFVGELLPEISGVENHSAKKEKNKVTVPRRKQMRKIDRKEKNIFKILNVQNEEVSSLKPFLLQTYFHALKDFGHRLSKSRIHYLCNFSSFRHDKSNAKTNDITSLNKEAQSILKA